MSSPFNRNSLAKVVAAVGLAAGSKRFWNFTISIEGETPAPGLTLDWPAGHIQTKSEVETRLLLELIWIEGGRKFAGVQCNPLGLHRASDLARILLDIGDARAHGRILADYGQEAMRFLDDNAGNIERVAAALLHEGSLQALHVQSVIGGN